METITHYQPSIFNPDVSDPSIFWLEKGGWAFCICKSDSIQLAG